MKLHWQWNITFEIGVFVNTVVIHWSCSGLHGAHENQLKH